MPSDAIIEVDGDEIWFEKVGRNSTDVVFRLTINTPENLSQNETQRVLAVKSRRDLTKERIQDELQEWKEIHDAEVSGFTIVEEQVCRWGIPKEDAIQDDHISPSR